MRKLSARCFAVLCAVACTTVAVVTMWPANRHTRTDDRNGDGRPDVWRQYDERGQLTKVVVDSNFDGRSDIQEYYERGVLVRRESDRNFDDQVDLVEEFDTATHDQIRSVVDLDYDGSADILILFRDGLPVFTQRARPLPIDLRQRGEIAAHDAQVVRRRGASPLVQLTDPFQTDAAVRGTQPWPVSADDCVDAPTSRGLPAAAVDTVTPLTSWTPLVTSIVQPRAFRTSFPRSPRGPPLPLA